MYDQYSLMEHLGLLNLHIKNPPEDNRSSFVSGHQEVVNLYEVFRKNFDSEHCLHQRSNSCSRITFSTKIWHEIENHIYNRIKNS